MIVCLKYNIFSETIVLFQNLRIVYFSRLFIFSKKIECCPLNDHILQVLGSYTFSHDRNIYYKVTRNDNYLKVWILNITWRFRKRFPLSLTYDNRRLVKWRHRSRLEIVTSQCLFDLGAWWRLENRNNYLMNRKERISRCPKNWRFVASRIRIIFLVEPFIQNTESNRIDLEHSSESGNRLS